MVSWPQRARLLSAALVLLLSACATPPTRVAPTLSEQEQRGERVFTQNCASCHATAPETVIVGPSLFGLHARAGERVAGQDARSYIEISIIDPGAYVNEGFEDLMPKTFGRTLTGEELDALLTYLLTLK